MTHSIMQGTFIVNTYVHTSIDIYPNREIPECSTRKSVNSIVHDMTTDEGRTACTCTRSFTQPCVAVRD